MATEKMLTKECFQNECKEHLCKPKDVGDVTPVIGNGNEVKAHKTLFFGSKKKTIRNGAGQTSIVYNNIF